MKKKKKGSGPSQRFFFNDIDWRKPNWVIAVEMGCTPQTVYYARKAAKKPMASLCWGHDKNPWEQEGES